MKILRRVIKEGELIPDWYGVAYWNFDSMTGVCYPIGINVIVHILRELLAALKSSLVQGSDYNAKLLQRAYDLGRMDAMPDFEGKARTRNKWEITDVVSRR